jgi:hypothetical protein
VLEFPQAIIKVAKHGIRIRFNISTDLIVKLVHTNINNFFIRAIDGTDNCSGSLLLKKKNPGDVKPKSFHASGVQAIIAESNGRFTSR